MQSVKLSGRAALVHKREKRDLIDRLEAALRGTQLAIRVSQDEEHVHFIDVNVDVEGKEKVQTFTFDHVLLMFQLAERENLLAVALTA